MITKVALIEIKRTLNVEKNIFYQFMRDMQYQCFRFSNKAITLLWDYQQFDFAYKEKYGQYFLEANSALPSGYKKVGSDILNTLKEEIPYLHSNCKDALIHMVETKWRNNRADVLKGNKSIPSFRRNLPIELHNKQFMDSKKNVRIFNAEGMYKTIISLLPKNIAQDLGLKDGNVELELIVKEKYITTIVDRLISGEYKLSMSKMQYDHRKKKWFLILTYSFESAKKELDKNKVLGIDLGMNVPAVVAVSNSLSTKFIGNRNEIERFEREVYQKRKQLQKSCVWASDGAMGHGIKRRTKRLESISNNITNFKATKNHCYSREIINFALEHQCATIQLEDLSGIAENDIFLKRWTYFDLQQKIINKANEHGIKVVKIKSNYTSQRCNKCGFIHKGIEKKVWRPTQDCFKCVNCGHKTNADVNAAKNIALKDIEKIIEKQIILQEKITD